MAFVNTHDGKDDRYSHQTIQVNGLCDRSKRVTFRGETPSEEYHGYVEVMSGRDGIFDVHTERSTLKKYAKNAKWHTQSHTITISAEDWAYLKTAE